MPAKPRGKARAGRRDALGSTKAGRHRDTRHRQREPTENARPPEATNHGHSRGERARDRKGRTDHETKIRKTRARPTPPNHEKGRPNHEKRHPNRKKEAPQKPQKPTPTRSEGHARGGCQTQTHPAPTAPPTKRSSTPHPGKQQPPPREAARTTKRRSPRHTDGETNRTPPIFEIPCAPLPKQSGTTKNRAGEAPGRRRVGRGA